jgi:hypothetical protein
VSTEDNKRVVANFVEVCQNQHDLAAADEIFHPDFVNHYAPGGHPLAPTPRPAGGFQVFSGLFCERFRLPRWRSMSNSRNAHPLRAASNAACSSASSKTPEFHERSSWSFSDRAGGEGVR